MNDSKTLDMTKGPLLRPLIYFSLPIMVTSILQLLFNAADIVVVGWFEDATAVAAVGSNSALINLLVNLFVGIAMGSTVVIASCIGAGQRNMEKEVHTTFSIGILFGFAVCLVGVLFSRQFLIWMQTPSDVIDQAALYLRIYFCGTPAFLIYTFGRSILIPTGDTKHPLYYLLISGIVNVILNIILVAGFGLGVSGVAIATVVSQILSAVLMTKKLLSLNGQCHLSLRRLRIDVPILSRILRLGLPAGLQNVIFSISNVLIQSSINTLGTTFVAGNSAGLNLEGFVYTSMNAFNQGCMTFSGQNYGGGCYKRLRKVYRIGVISSMTVGLVLGLLMNLAASPLLHIYLPRSPEGVSYGIIRLSILVLFDFICGAMDCTSCMLRGMNKSLYPMAVTILACCGFRILWIYTAFQWAVSTLSSTDAYRTLLISYPISWVFALSLLYPYYRIELKKLLRKANI